MRHATVTHFYCHIPVNPPYDRLHSKIDQFKAGPDMLSAIDKLAPTEDYRMSNELWMNKSG